MDCRPPGPSIHGIFQARVLEWGTIAFSMCDVNMVYYLRNSWLYCRNRQPSNQSIIIHQRFKIFSCKLCCWLRKLPREANLHVRKVFMLACAVMIAGAGEERHRELSPSNYVPILGKNTVTLLNIHWPISRRETFLSMLEREVTQSCPTLCDPMDCSPPGSSVHGIFRARVLQWGVIAFFCTI